MDEIQAIKPTSLEQCRLIVQTCLDKCVHDIDEVSRDVMDGVYTLAMSSTGFWIFSVEGKRFIIEGCQGLHICNKNYLEQIVKIARENNCECISFKTKHEQLVLIAKRMGFFPLKSETDTYMVKYVNE